MSTKSSKKIKNLEQEVEIILEDDSDDESVTKEDENDTLAKTLSQGSRVKDVTPKVSQRLQELYQTPRRSGRKSVKPPQDYDDIVNKSLRSSTRSVKKQLLVVEERENEEFPKWTPAKVGRVSQKRGRKSRRTGKLKQKDVSQNVSDDQPKDEGEREQSEVEEIIEEENSNDFEMNKPQLSVTPDYAIESHPEQVTDDNILEKGINISAREKHFDGIENKMKQHNEEGESDLHDHHETEDRKEISLNGKHKYNIVLEDSKNCPVKVTTSQEDVRTAHESNMRNKDLKNDLVSFEKCLKSQEITNLSDLGLNPIKYDNEDVTKNNEIKSFSEDTEDMPSFNICDDDDEEFKPEQLNDTFETQNSVKVLEHISEEQPNTAEEFMETLILSDECETPEKKYHVNLCETKIETHLNLYTPNESAINVRSLPKAILPALLSSGKQNKIDTNYKAFIRADNKFIFNNHNNENGARNNSNKYISNALSLTTLEPKEIVLSGIRKRSSSLCINTQEQKHKKKFDCSLSKPKPDRMVSFHSPANQTTLIDDLDLKIANSVKKQKREGKLPPNNYVTTRRKRSLSLDESISMSLLSKLPRPVIQGISKKQQNLPSAFEPPKRTKLPNFSAIHQKRFQEMENLVEHVNRKQQRSKNLINSATKLKTVSAQKSESSSKNCKTKLTEKHKAVKKINLEIKNSLSNSTNIQNFNKSRQLVEPNKTDINIPVVKKETISRKYLKPTQSTNIEKTGLNVKSVAPSKPAFNLSTSIMAKPSASSTHYADVNVSHTGNDKMNSRLQRHMDLFKGRAPLTRSKQMPRTNDIVKGVRSNRRFELQMQHRKNLEQ